MTTWKSNVIYKPRLPTWPKGTPPLKKPGQQIHLRIKYKLSK